MTLGVFLCKVKLMKPRKNKLDFLLSSSVLALGGQWDPYIEADTPDVLTIQGVEHLFKLFLNNIIRLGGIAVFIMILVGGFKYLTSGGDPKKSEEARKVLTYAVMGLGLMIGSWLIINFVKVFTGVDVTQFIFPSS